MSVQRKGRTLAITVDELLDSPRLKIALERYPTDKSFLRALLIELGYFSQTATRFKLIKTYATHSSLNQADMIALLRSITDIDNYECYFGLSEIERRYYMENPKFKLSQQESDELFEKIRKKFMES